jgi:hypothetical protein
MGLIRGQLPLLYWPSHNIWSILWTQSWLIQLSWQLDRHQAQQPLQLQHQQLQQPPSSRKVCKTATAQQE